MLDRRQLYAVFALLLALLSTAGYVAWSCSHGLAGFPLDDAWIHQTYARNLAQTGELAYLAGEPSAGSTSPAWSYLLSVGYLLHVDSRLWAYLLGGLALAATAGLLYRLSLRLSPSRPTAALFAGLFCAVEWHLVWAAASGMETMLFTALSLALLEYFFGQIANRRASEGPASLQAERAIVSSVGIGLVAGCLALTRPEGLGLAALVIAALLVLPQPPTKSEVRSRLLTTSISLLVFCAMLTPYILFNLETSGSLFPNTFYAKQAEYETGLSLLGRFWTVLGPTLVGAQMLLVPGFCYAIYNLIRQRNWPAALPVAWWLAFMVVYAVRLPVSYHYGRYVMPTIPILILYGVWGTTDLMRPRSPHSAARALSKAVPLALAALVLIFLGRGAMAYSDDVGFIEGEMVATARWLNEHTEPDEIIAVHDIGAVGFFTDRPLLDLAGLITPEVIPFITDAAKLTEWMIEQGATYTVFFPDFSPTYAELAVDPRLQAVTCTNYAWTLEMSHQNMCVYRLSP